MKEKLQQFKDMYKFFSERAEKIAELKNTDSDFDYLRTLYEDNEWEVTFVKKARCGCCPDDSWFVYVKDDEILSDYENIVAKLKFEREEEERKAKEKKEAQDKARKIALEKMELENYKKLKEKYEGK
jgi:hypothetical protein